MKKKSKQFVPMNVRLNKEAFNRDKLNAEQKLKYLAEGIKWSRRHIDVSKIDLKGFLFDMEKQFEIQVLEQHSDIVKKQLGVDKLYYLLDINISELKEIQEKCDNISVSVGVKDDEYFTSVQEKDYWLMTSSEEENEKLIRCNNLIDALELVAKYNKIYPLNIVQGTSNFVSYDVRQNKYFLTL